MPRLPCVTRATRSSREVDPKIFAKVLLPLIDSWHFANDILLQVDVVSLATPPKMDFAHNVRRNRMPTVGLVDHLQLSLLLLSLPLQCSSP